MEGIKLNSKNFEVGSQFILYYILDTRVGKYIIHLIRF